GSHSFEPKKITTEHAVFFKPNRKELMTRSELFEELRKWLKANEFVFEASQEHATALLTADGERGQWHCRLICEEDPPVLQVVCHFPIPVPKCKLLSASLLIHNMNLHVRLGAFTLAEEGRRIGFRLPFLIRPE